MLASLEKSIFQRTQDVLRSYSIIQISLFWLFFCFGAILYFIPLQRLVSGYPSLDWYPESNTNDKRRNHLAKLLTASDLHVLELWVMLFSYYIHRHFPEEFSLTFEIRANIVLNWAINWGLNLIYGFRETYEPDLCLLGLWSNGLVDMLRCITLVGILYWVSSSKSQNFPLPHSWIFQDLSKFIFEPRCMEYFIKYIREKESSKNFERVNKLMNLYLSDFDSYNNSSTFLDISINNDRPSAMSSTKSLRSTYETGFRVVSKTDITNSNRQLFLDLLDDLQHCYERYSKTRSFKQLLKKISEFEAITENCSKGQ